MSCMFRYIGGEELKKMEEGLSGLESTVLAKAGEFRDYFYEADAKYEKGVVEGWKEQEKVGTKDTWWKDGHGNYMPVPDTYASIEHVYSILRTSFGTSIGRLAGEARFPRERDDYGTEKEKAQGMIFGVIEEVATRQLKSMEEWKQKATEAKSGKELMEVEEAVFQQSWANIHVLNELYNLCATEVEATIKRLALASNAHEIIRFLEKEMAERKEELLRRFRI